MKRYKMTFLVDIIAVVLLTVAGYIVNSIFDGGLSIENCLILTILILILLNQHYHKEGGE